MRLRTALVSFLLFLIACDEPVDQLSGRRKNRPLTEDESSAEGDDGASGDPTQPGSCDVGAPHVGFAKNDFVADRKPGAIAENRRRVKPYTAMRSEMERAIGVAPAALAQSSAAFGEVPARWYIEPTAGAVSLYTTYTLAFSACYAALDDAPHAVPPTAATATSECASLQHKAWQRTPLPDETKSCADLVLALTSETPRRRWAHGCASIMTSAGFTTY
ncbi:MAG: hypothetical protein KIT84_15990 [Labilithrix sp.]|nr:hypothetical protein [Labilithrix sp.]MCW5812529.1 hypothetical protein [Labilithrix sp.]